MPATQRIIYTAFYLLPVLSSPIVLGNDSMVGNVGATVFPIRSADIQLQREVITFEIRRGTASVNADLSFFNHSGAPITAAIGFPADRGLDEDYDGDYAPPIKSLDVWVNEKRVAVRKVPSTHERTELPFDEWFVFEATFQAQQITMIKHQYKLELGGGAEGDHALDYILSTGSMWKDTIDETKIVLLFDHPPSTPKVHYRDQLIYAWRDGSWITPKTCCSEGAAKQPLPSVDAHYLAGPVPTWTFTLKNYVPKGDFSVYWGSPYEYPTGVPGSESAMHCAFRIHRLHLALRDGDELEEAIDDAKSCPDASWLRNWIYARRGRLFQSARYKKDFAPGRWFAPNKASFDEAWLSEHDRHAIQLLLEIERKSAPKQ